MAVLEVANRAIRRAVDWKVIYNEVEGLPLLERPKVVLGVLSSAPTSTVYGRNRRYGEALETAVLLVSIPSKESISLASYTHFQDLNLCLTVSFFTTCSMVTGFIQWFICLGTPTEFVFPPMICLGFDIRPLIPIVPCIPARPRN